MGFFCFPNQVGSFLSYCANGRIHRSILLRTDEPAQGRLSGFAAGVHTTGKSFHPAGPEEI